MRAHSILKVSIFSISKVPTLLNLSRFDIFTIANSTTSLIDDVYPLLLSFSKIIHSYLKQNTLELFSHEVENVFIWSSLGESQSTQAMTKRLLPLTLAQHPEPVGPSFPKEADVKKSRSPPALA